MKHYASRGFRSAYEALPPDVRALADKNFALLKSNPKHPSLHFKKVGRFWSVRIGLSYRAAATQLDGDMRWHRIGPHDEYDGKLR